jgi:hypothetical protein
VIIVLVAIAVVAVLGLWFALRRGPRAEPGMVSFQRHIDALSPEARRQVRDHLQTDASGADVVPNAKDGDQDNDEDDKLPDGDDDGDDDEVDGNEDH